jgi:hypothetical protein
MTEITDNITDCFKSCGLKKTYDEKIERFKLYKTNQNYINNFLIEFNGNGVLRNHKYICNKCHTKIKPKKSGKTKKNDKNKNRNAINNSNNNTNNDDLITSILTKSHQARRAFQYTYFPIEK